MGIVKAIAGAAAGMWEGQWKAAFWNDAPRSDSMLVCGRKHTSLDGSNGIDDNEITDGSLIIVYEGQCAIVVDHGEVAAAYTEPGEYLYHLTREKKSFFGEMKERISYGGDAPYLTQRIYFVDLHEFLDHPFSVTLPSEFGGVTLHGVYSCHVKDPVAFYQKVTGNTEQPYRFSDFSRRIDEEFRDKFLRIASERCSRGFRPDRLLRDTRQLCEDLRAAMLESDVHAFGVEVTALALTLDGASVGSLRTHPVGSDQALSRPVRTESSVQYTPPERRSFRITPATHYPAGNEPRSSSPVSSEWTCGCGAKATSQFCPECGKPQPWQCTCGTKNQGNFCENCGSARPETDAQI